MIRHVVFLAPLFILAQPKKTEPKNLPLIIVATPLGLAPGTKGTVTLRGLRLDGVTEVKLPTGKGVVKLVRKGKVGVPTMQKPEKVGDSEAVVELTLSADIPEGTVTVEVVAPGGNTSHKLLVARNVVTENEPNNGYRQSQMLTLPAVVEGVVASPQDVDVFSFQGKAGQKIVAEVHAARHGSALDGLLTLVDDRDAILAANDDAEGADPRITFTLPRDGVYHLSLIDAHDQGGPAFVYRLVVR